MMRKHRGEDTEDLEAGKLRAVRSKSVYQIVIESVETREEWLFLGRERLKRYSSEPTTESGVGKSGVDGNRAPSCRADSIVVPEPLLEVQTRPNVFGRCS